MKYLIHWDVEGARHESGVDEVEVNGGITCDEDLRGVRMFITNAHNLRPSESKSLRILSFSRFEKRGEHVQTC